MDWKMVRRHRSRKSWMESVTVSIDLTALAADWENRDPIGVRLVDGKSVSKKD